jgi:hypothetical protein
LRDHSTSEINSVRLLTGNFATITVTGSVRQLPKTSSN